MKCALQIAALYKREHTNADQDCGHCDRRDLMMIMGDIHDLYPLYRNHRRFAPPRLLNMCSLFTVL